MHGGKDAFRGSTACLHPAMIGRLIANRYARYLKQDRSRLMDSKTKEILDNFEQINRIPRCSKNEQQIAAWLKTWAQNQGFDTQMDGAGNMVVRVPPSKGFESAPTIVLQGHMDMVCEKRPDVVHDFSKDPIRHIVSGEWLSADGTSLGADNGIALALVMALAADQGVDHPKLELLFTVDEETGLIGANELDSTLLTGRILINIDSEDEGVFTVGCAGGINTEIELPISLAKLEDGIQQARLSVSGLRGGHSGIDINTGRASANKLLARILSMALDQMPLRLVSFDGGTTHNAIARDAQANVALAEGQFEALGKVVSDLEKVVQQEFATVESGLEFNLTPIAQPASGAMAATETDTRRIADLLSALPHGVVHMSMDAEAMVDTSSNLAVVNLSEKGLYVLSSQRSAFTSRVWEIARQVAAVARLSGGASKTGSFYPSWQPDMESDLLKRCRETYARLFGADPVVEIIHAGLECAVIGDKFPEMEMISVGPTMKNPHSPDERLYIPSLSKLWQFLVALLASFKK